MWKGDWFVLKLTLANSNRTFENETYVRLLWSNVYQVNGLLLLSAQSAWAVEYTDCTPAGGKILPKKYLGYEIKPSNGEAPAVEIWGIHSAPSLPLLQAPFWPAVVGPDRVLSMGQIEQTVSKQMNDIKL